MEGGADGKPRPSLEAKDGALVDDSAALRGGSGVGGVTPKLGTEPKSDGAVGDNNVDVDGGAASDDTPGILGALPLATETGGVADFEEGKAKGSEETGGSLASEAGLKATFGGGAKDVGKGIDGVVADVLESFAGGSVAFV